MVAKRTRAGKWSSDGAPTHQRLAVTLEQAAEQLGVPLRDIKRAAVGVEPYIAHGGVKKWPIRELARVLADCGRVVDASYLRPVAYEQARQRRRRHRERTGG